MTPDKFGIIWSIWGNFQVMHTLEFFSYYAPVRGYARDCEGMRGIVRDREGLRGIARDREGVRGIVKGNFKISLYSLAQNIFKIFI